MAVANQIFDTYLAARQDIEDLFEMTSHAEVMDCRAFPWVETDDGRVLYKTLEGCVLSMAIKTRVEDLVVAHDSNGCYYVFLVSNHDLAMAKDCGSVFKGEF